MTPRNGRRAYGLAHALAGVALLLVTATVATWMISGTWGGDVDRPRVVVEAR